jgi:predicted kinase
MEPKARSAIIRLAYSNPNLRSHLLPLLSMGIEKNLLKIAKEQLVKTAAPLNDPKYLRYQAVFIIGAGGSGKGYYSHRYLKYMPGAGSKGISREEYTDYAERGKQDPTKDTKARLLSNIDFTKATKILKERGFNIEIADNPSKASIPFRLYSYDNKGAERLVPKSKYNELPRKIQGVVEDIENIIFSEAKHEIPSYWRQVNPDLYKEELPGYAKEEPGYVHEMSSIMSKAYFEAALETGDPLIVDGTGVNSKKMIEQFNLAKKAGYRVSLVYVWVPLTVNQIRNATRPRNVDPDQITIQWKLTQASYDAIKSKADKAKRIDNRDTPRDIPLYEKNKDKINNFIAQKTGYITLYGLISNESPEELRDYGVLLSN